MKTIYSIYGGRGYATARELMDDGYSAWEALAIDNDSEPEIVTEDKEEAYAAWDRLNKDIHIGRYYRGKYEIEGYYMESFTYESDEDIELDSWTDSELLEVSQFGVSAFEGMTWGDLSYGEEQLLLDNAVTFLDADGNETWEDGECTIKMGCLSVEGRLEDAEIVIDYDAVIRK